MLFAFSCYSQQGTIRGTIIDDGSGVTVPFANIVIGEPVDGVGTTSDLDGKYSINLDPGTYVMTFSFLGYADFIISEVVVTAGEVTLLDIRMKEEGQVIDEVVVTAKQVRNTEAALATIKRKSTKVLDGISSQTFSKTGDSNAGEAIKRVTGVSVEGGKHIYVRGLGDRYSKTIVNSMDIPGLDPDRNSFEMDLLPTNLIDNILVYKTFSPDLPGDFTGGLVDVITKDFPEARSLNISGSIGYNPSMHLNSNFISYNGGNRDWLGYDDGSRKLRIDSRLGVPNPVLNDPYTTAATSSMSSILAGTRATSGLNSSISLSTGNQIAKEKVTFGYIASLNYKTKSTYYEDAEFNTFIFDEQNFPGEFKLINDKENIGDVGKQEVLWSAMGGLSMKFKSHRFSLNAFRIQNGISTAANQSLAISQSNVALLKRDVLEYNERSVTNVSLQGKHVFSEGKLEIDWKFTPSFIEVDEPDLRLSAFERISENNFQIAPAVGADVSRTWRNLQETNLTGKVDFTYNFKVGDKDSKLKFGGLGLTKERDFSIENFIVRVINQTALDLQGDPNRLWGENLWTPQSNQGTYIRGQFEPANSFNATQSILSAYVLNELPIGEKLKAIYGVRMEKAQNFYTGQSNDGQKTFNNAKVLDELNFLPSLNLVYEVQEAMNLRLSYNKTLARPSFKEKSIAQIQDRITGRTYIGNIDLEQTEIDNIDLRWEYFGFGGELLSISGFYKNFKNPIEILPFSDAAPDNFTPRNLEDGADLFGVELEFSKRLGFLVDALNNFTLGSNITLVKSEVERTTLLSEDNATRTMFGQSPYILNMNVGYRNTENAIEFNASYNVQGKRIVVVGAGSLSDVYELPYNSLSAKVSKRLANGIKLSFSADNILNDDREKQYEAFSGDIGTFELLRPGRNFSIGLSWSM